MLSYILMYTGGDGLLDGLCMEGLQQVDSAFWLTAYILYMYIITDLYNLLDGTPVASAC